jgi:hypothetical protein
MRYEVMRLLQLVFSLSLMFVAFMGGLFVGWRRWGRARPIDLTDTATDAPSDPADPPARRDLFAPELDLTWTADALDLRAPREPARLGLPAAPSDEALA